MDVWVPMKTVLWTIGLCCVVVREDVVAKRSEVADRLWLSFISFVAGLE